MARVVYGPIDRDRIQVIRDGFGWVDHRFVRGRHIDGCSPQALALYLFLVTGYRSGVIRRYANACRLVRQNCWSAVRN